jgi:hypothetical protein
MASRGISCCGEALRVLACGADDDEYEIPDIPKTVEPKRNGLDEEEEPSDDEKAKVPGVRGAHLNLRPSTPHRGPTSESKSCADDGAVSATATANSGIWRVFPPQRFPHHTAQATSATLGAAGRGVGGIAGVTVVL